MNKRIARGEVWMVDLDPVVGHEQAKKRPCLVVSEESFNSGPSELVVVLPITSRYRELSWLVKIAPPEGGLPLTSYVICNQLRTVSQKRFGNKLGTIKKETFKPIEQRLRFLLSLSNIELNNDEQ